MQKTITYLYPDINKAASLKVFQDRTNQIKAFFFTKESIKEVERMESACHYSVYFLFDNSEDDNKKVYVGQSMNGVSRIFDHIRNKDFWTHCIMFVTDNNSFDKLSIDYMEFDFIGKFKKSSYVLTNKDQRVNEPNVSIYDRPNLMAYIEQIEFLLNAEGVMLGEVVAGEKEVKTTYFYPKSKRYIAELMVKDGLFILLSGSAIRRPNPSTINWKSGSFYTKQNEKIDAYIRDGKAEEKDGKLELLVNMSFKTPSAAAVLVSGGSENGWDFFKGLNELRNTPE